MSVSVFFLGRYIVGGLASWLDWGVNVPGEPGFLSVHSPIAFNSVIKRSASPQGRNEQAQIQNHDTTRDDATIPLGTSKMKRPHDVSFSDITPI